MNPVRHPANTPAIGTVAIHLTSRVSDPTRLFFSKIGAKMTHPAQILSKCIQLTALKPPDKIPTPVVAPTIHMVVETGIPNCEARMTVMEAPNSIEKPREGE